MAARTRRRVRGATTSARRTTFETVERETPASFATSASVAGRRTVIGRPRRRSRQSHAGRRQDAFLGRMKSILVLDAEAECTRLGGQCIVELGPPGAIVVAVANGSEIPRNARRVARPAVVEQAIEGELRAVVSNVLGMAMANEGTQAIDHGERIHALPEEVTWVEVDADSWRGVMQAQVGVDVEDVGAGCSSRQISTVAQSGRPDR